MIKEAYGNGYVALSISLLLIVADGMLDIFHNGAFSWPWLWGALAHVGPALVIAGGAIYYLRQMHFIHVQRQYDYLDRALTMRRSALDSGSSSAGHGKH